MNQAGRSVVAVVAVLLAWPGTGADAATLRGTVVAADGSPVAGARVWAVDIRGVGFDRREAVADAEGRYAIAVGPGSWTVEAGRDALGPADFPPPTVVEAADPPPATVRLKPQGRLRAKLVAAETGRPLAGARLVLDNGLDPTTDAAGRVEVAGLARHRNHEAAVVAPGRQTWPVRFEIADGPTTDLEVAVPRGVTAVGRVLDPAGAPVAGAWVVGNGTGPAVRRGACTIRADDQGRFAYAGLPPDRTFALEAEAPVDGLGPAIRSGLRAPLDGSPLAVDLQLRPAPASPPGRVVAGVVLDPAGKPVGARVRWGVAPLARPVEARTDAEGRFRLDPVPDEDGAVAVLPDRPDLAPALLSVHRADRELRVALEPGRTATGVVRDPAGTPCPGVVVLPIIGGIGLPSWVVVERRTYADDHGRFAIAGVPAAGLWGSFRGDGLANLSNLPLRADRENVVTVEPAGVILGRVVDGDGKPVRNFRVLIRRPRAVQPDNKTIYLSALGGAGLTFTADDGTFLVRDLTAGAPYRVAILAPGRGATAVDPVVALPRSRWAADSAVPFELGPPNVLEVRVRVREPDSGRPVPAARVAVVYGDPSQDGSNWTSSAGSADDSTYARTDAAGVATFPPLTFDEGTILVQAPGYARQSFGWRDHAANLDAWLQPEAVIEGTVLDLATGLPPEGATVSLSSPWLGRIARPLDPGPEGRFLIGELAAGPYTLLILSGGNNRSHTEAIILQLGERKVRNLRLKVPGR